MEEFRFRGGILTQFFRGDMKITCPERSEADLEAHSEDIERCPFCDSVLGGMTQIIDRPVNRPPPVHFKPGKEPILDHFIALRLKEGLIGHVGLKLERRPFLRGR